MGGVPLFQPIHGLVLQGQSRTYHQGADQGGMSLGASVCKRRGSRECPVLLSICRAEEEGSCPSLKRQPVFSTSAPAARS